MDKFIKRHWPTMVGALGVAVAISVVVFYENKTFFEVYPGQLDHLNESGESLLFITNKGDFFLTTMKGIAEIIKVHDTEGGFETMVPVE